MGPTPPPHRPPALLLSCGPVLCALCSVLARGNRGGERGRPRVDLWELGAYKLKLGVYWGAQRAFTPESAGGRVPGAYDFKTHITQSTPVLYYRARPHEPRYGYVPVRGVESATAAPSWHA